MEPHIFGVAAEVHNALKMDVNSIDQSVIISGESGAGKVSLMFLRCLSVRDDFLVLNMISKCQR